MRHAVMVVSIMMAFAGCVADPYATGRGPLQIESADVSERSPDNRYTIVYRGSPRSPADQVYDLALLRAATVTLQKDATWFEVVTDYSRLETERETLYERNPLGRGLEQTADCGLLGCTTSARPEPGFPDLEGQETSRSFLTQKFEIIVHYDDLPAGRANAFDAVELSNELRTKYAAQQE